MNGKFQLLTTTVIGGIVFLVPLIVCIVILGKAFEIMRKLAVPLDRALSINSVAGIVVADLIAVVAIVLVCFIAGLVAKTALAAQLITWLESNLLSRIPVYAFIKGMTDSVAGLEESESLKPVLARYDDNWQVAFMELFLGYAEFAADKGFAAGIAPLILTPGGSIFMLEA